jgi:hypothetical protein
MRTFIAIALAWLLAIAGPSSAQMTLTGAGSVKVPQVSGGCSQATAFLSRTSGLDTTHTSLYTTMICGMVADGDFASLDVIYILATQNSATALLNLTSSSFALTPQNSPTFTADQGYTGDGATSWLNTNWAPATNGVNYTLNSASFGAYILTNRTGASGNTSILGSFSSSFTDETFFRPNVDGAGTNFVSFNANTGVSIGAAVVTSQGSWIASRVSSSAVNLYRNGNITPLGTGTTASGTISLISMALLGINNNNGGVNSPSTDQLAAAFFGGALSAASQQRISNRINAYMSGLATPVNVY